MYRSLKAIMQGAMTLGLVALTFAPTADAQRPATTTTTKPAATAAAPAPQKSKARTNKWVFGAHTVAAPGISITGPDVDGTFNTALGGGLGIMAGYEINRAVTLFGAFDVARQNSGVNWMSGSFGLVHAEVGVRTVLSQSNPQMQPYLQGAIGRRSLGARVTDYDADEVYDMSLTGNMISFGGGMQYTISPKVSLDGGVQMAIGTFNHYDYDGELGSLQLNSSTSIRLKAGVVWRP